MSGERAERVIDIEASPGHVRAAVALVEVLSRGATAALAEVWEDWSEAAEIWEEGLTEAERLTLLGFVIRACQFPEADALMDAAVRDRHAQPGVRFGPIRDCAENWAAWATEAEIKAYLLACFAQLPQIEQLNFLRAVQKKVLE